MDLIESLGYLALGSRLKRLSDRFMREVASLYERQDIDFEPRWFPIYYLLLQNGGPVQVTDIAKQLGVSHPAVIQVVKDMSRSGVILAEEGKDDRRQRLISLSEKGKRMAPELTALWNDIRSASRDVTQTVDPNFLQTIDRMEQALDQNGVFARVKASIKERQLCEVKIHDYRAAFKPLFRSLNEEWLKKYFKIEPHDTEMLSDPDGYIIGRGGAILFAEIGGEIVGTCALIPWTMSDSEHGKAFELAKMAVTERAQGRQIGKKLAFAAIERAKLLGANLIVLESSSLLAPALKLYEQLGFKHAPRDRQSDYARSDVFMKLDLSETGDIGLAEVKAG